MALRVALPAVRGPAPVSIHDDGGVKFSIQITLHYKVSR
jgi:hypothetical protein